MFVIGPKALAGIISPLGTSTQIRLLLPLLRSKLFRTGITKLTTLAAVPPKPEEVEAPPKLSDRALLRWQRRLLPFMTGFVVVMAVLFFLFSGFHLYQVSNFIETEHGQNIRDLIQTEIAKPTANPPTADDITQHALLLLEADTLDKRYHEASALLMSRIWSRQLAFITGMVMAFLGAVFILGKLSESTSQISGGSGDWKVAVTSASPGIILAVLGTTLLVSSLYVRASLDVIDGPAYVNTLRRPAIANPSAATPSAKTDDARPLDLNELQKLDSQKTAAPPKQ